MQRSATGSRRLRYRRTRIAAAVVITAAAGAFGGLPPAFAVNPPVIDPGAVPADGPPGPVQPMKQNSYCTGVGVLPGSDFRVQPKYMDMLNLPEAWRFGRGGGVKVAVVDTGVTPHPRLPNLIGGGDYVMAGGDGLSDCDAHGTIVASMIAAAPGNDATALPAAPPRSPVTIPTTEKPPPPQTVTLSPLPQTITVVPATPTPASPPDDEGPPPAPPGPPPQAPAASNGQSAVALPSFAGGRHMVPIDSPRDNPRPRDPVPPPPPPADAFTGIAPDAALISIRQTSQAFGLKDPYTGDEDPQTRQKKDNIATMARAIVHAADMGASIINISEAICMTARNVLDQRALGAAIRYAAVDKDAVIVASAGDTSQRDCKQNQSYDPLQPKDPRGWNGVTTVVTPAWFSDYVLTVGAVHSDGEPLGNMSVAGPWVSIAAPGTDVVGLSPRDDSLINAIDGNDNTLLVPAGTSFSTAIVSGVAALVRSKYPQLSAHQIINRLIHTARAPARGVDNAVGYGVVDPVAALTWDVPEGQMLPPAQLSSPLNAPPLPAKRNMAPVWAAAGGLVAVLLVAGVVTGGAVLIERSRRT